MEIQGQKSVAARFQFSRVEVPFRKLPHFQGEAPSYQTEGASGFDIRAQLENQLVVPPGQSVLVPTGLVFEIPSGFELQARPRSGLAAKHSVTVLNSPGTIDSDYRGEVKIILINHGMVDFLIQPGDRIAQLVLAPVFHADLREVEDLSESQRGSGGFGSTGRS